MKRILIKALQMPAQMRILHWQTTTYSEHIAFGTFYDAVNEKLDRLIEALQGKYGRIMLGGLDSFQIADYANLKLNVFILDADQFFTSEIYTCGVDKMNDDEIVNIIQEIRGEIDKLKYLLTLR